MLYPRSDTPSYPESERDAGHVTILQKTAPKAFTYRYVCQCVHCGTRYHVEHGTDWGSGAYCTWRSTESLLADLLSRDEDRVRLTTYHIIETRNAELLAGLAAKRGDIKMATDTLEFAKVPWMPDYVAFALAKLSFFASRSGCMCLLYPKHGQHPVLQSIEGYVSIVQEVESPYDADGKLYLCECADCGALYDVYSRTDQWGGLDWQWTPRAPR